MAVYRTIQQPQGECQAAHYRSEKVAHWQTHVVHKAVHENSKLAAVVLIVMGLFFTPFFIGIPILLLGLYRLFK